MPDLSSPRAGSRKSFLNAEMLEESPDPDVVDVSEEPDPEAAALAFMRADLAADLPLDGDALLYRHALIRLGETSNGERWFWYQRYHHLMVDGFSFAAIARRIAEIYTALRRRKPLGDSPFTSFAEVVEEYQSYEGSKAQEADRCILAGPRPKSADPDRIVAAEREDPAGRGCVLAAAAKNISSARRYDGVRGARRRGSRLRRRNGDGGRLCVSASDERRDAIDGRHALHATHGIHRALRRRSCRQRPACAAEHRHPRCYCRRRRQRLPRN